MRIMKNFDIKEQIILQICDSEILIDCTPHARRSRAGLIFTKFVHKIDRDIRVKIKCKSTVWFS